MRSHHYLWLALVLLMCWPIGEALAFKITEPAAGKKLTPGQTVTAHVDLGNDIGIVKVRYQRGWYLLWSCSPEGAGSGGAARKSRCRAGP